MKNIVTIMMIFVLSISFLPTNSINAAQVENKKINVHFDNFSFSTSVYDRDNVHITYTKKNNTTIARIIENGTNKVLETMKCTPVNSSKSSNKVKALYSNYSDYTSYYTIQRSVYKGPVTVTMQVYVELYKQGSFSCINSICGQDMMITNGNTAYLSNVNTFARSTSGSFPCSEIEYVGNAVVTIETSISASGQLELGLSVEDMVNLGFSVSVEGSCTYYFRAPITIQGTFRTYRR